MLEVNPDMPYGHSGTPYVNQWFSTADAPDAASFIRLLADGTLDELEKSGGVCIVSTHLGKGFAKNGVLVPDIARIIESLGRRPGWYVPATELLDYLALTQGKGRPLGQWKTAVLETRYLLDRMRARIL